MRRKEPDIQLSGSKGKCGKRKVCIKVKSSTCSNCHQTGHNTRKCQIKGNGEENKDAANEVPIQPSNMNKCGNYGELGHNQILQI